jgi:hypothetical protein
MMMTIILGRVGAERVATILALAGAVEVAMTVVAMTAMMMTMIDR